MLRNLAIFIIPPWRSVFLNEVLSLNAQEFNTGVEEVGERLSSMKS